MSQEFSRTFTGVHEENEHVIRCEANVRKACLVLCRIELHVDGPSAHSERISGGRDGVVPIVGRGRVNESACGETLHKDRKYEEGQCAAQRHGGACEKHGRQVSPRTCGAMLRENWPWHKGSR